MPGLYEYLGNIPPRMSKPSYSKLKNTFELILDQALYSETLLHKQQGEKLLPDTVTGIKGAINEFKIFVNATARSSQIFMKHLPKQSSATEAAGVREKAAKLLEKAGFYTGQYEDILSVSSTWKPGNRNYLPLSIAGLSVHT